MLYSQLKPHFNVAWMKHSVIRDLLVKSHVYPDHVLLIRVTGPVFMLNKYKLVSCKAQFPGPRLEALD